MQWLKEQGVDINARDKSGNSPMHYAAETDAVDAMKWLKEKGDDINARNNDNHTPMDIAMSYDYRGCNEVVEGKR